MDNNSKKGGYSKRPLWQWIVIYLIAAAIVYGLIYYFVLAKKGGYSYSSSNSAQSSGQNMYMPSQNSAAASGNPSASSSVSAKNSIQIQNYSFSPATLTVKAGESVTWTNNDSVGHSATSDDGTFDSGVLDPGKSASVTFSKPGTYTYHCSVHPTMHGTIIVQ